MPTVNRDSDLGTTELLRVSESSFKRENIVSSLADREIATRVEQADVVILPLPPDRARGRTNSFTGGVQEVFDVLRCASFTAEVATDSDNPPELVLHANWLDLGILLVKEGVAPLLISVLKDLLLKRLPRLQERQSATVRCELEVESSLGNKRLRYEGPADTFEKLMLSSLRSREVDKHEP